MLGLLASLFAIVLGKTQPTETSKVPKSQSLALSFVWQQKIENLLLLQSHSAAIREYIWTYAALEFALVGILVHLLYTAVSNTLTVSPHLITD